MNDFPILKRKIHDKRLVYLDNAATTQKPQQVIDAMSRYYETSNANVSRGVHVLAEESTTAYEQSRQKVAKFLDLPANQVVFTSGATDSINFVAGLAKETLKPGDEILLSIYEHHSNIVPWQQVALATGAKLLYVGLTDDYEFDLDDFTSKLSEKTRFVCVSHASNVLGTVTPIDQIVKQAQSIGAKVVVDGAQAAGHFPTTFVEQPDFYCFSAHKMLGPQGIGVLALSKRSLTELLPYRYGGGMIETVTKEESTLAQAPECFEAGTPNVAGAVGLAAAIDYIEKFGLENIHKHESELLEQAYLELQKIPELTMYGPRPKKERAAILSFTIKGVHPHDVAQILDSEGVAIRSGLHCAMPLHEELGVESLNRVSFALYNTREDVEVLVSALQKAIAMFGDSDE